MTGWRIGYCGGPQEIMNYVKNFQDHSTSNPTSISQVAALAALQASEEKVKEMCEEFRKRRDLIVSLFSAIPNVSFVKPEGAFYLFCDFSKLGDSEQIAKRMLDEVNVAAIPGDSFGAPGFMRISFSTSQERIKEGVRRIQSWIQKNCS